jgi:mono/diheme cytochrome c family protein
MKTAGHAVAVLLAVGLLSTPPAGAETGKETFAKMCVSCHAPDGGGVPALGPNLTDDCFLHGASEAEIRAVVANGSPTNPMMIGFEPQIGVESVQAVAQYVHGLIGTNVEGGRECQEAGSDAGAKAGAVAAPEAAPAPEAAAPALEGDIDRGSKLFQGLIRFENGGPSCISCHTVRNDAVISGGSLGKDITEKVTVASGAMVGGFVQSKPVMQKAFADSPLTEQEQADLAAFLADTYEQGQSMPGDTGIKLALSGVAGTVLLLGLYTMLWGRRKRFSVNRDIYDRQIKSSDL